MAQCARFDLNERSTSYELAAFNLTKLRAHWTKLLLTFISIVLCPGCETCTRTALGNELLRFAGLLISPNPGHNTINTLPSKMTYCVELIMRGCLDRLMLTSNRLSDEMRDDMFNTIHHLKIRYITNIQDDISWGALPFMPHSFYDTRLQTPQHRICGRDSNPTSVRYNIQAYCVTI